MGVIRSSTIYLGSTFISKALPFLLLPVLTKYLSPAEYGIVSLFQVSINVLSSLYKSGLNAHTMKHYYKSVNEEFSEIIFNRIIYISIWAFLTLIIVTCVIFLINNFLGIPDRWVFTLPVIALCNTINLQNLTILRHKDWVINYGIFEILRVIINFGLSVFLIVGIHQSWQGRLSGILISSISIGIISLINLYKLNLIKPKFNLNKIKDITRYSLPLIPAQISMIVIQSSDRFFLNEMLGKNAVGIYTLSYQFGMIVHIIAQSIIKAWVPRQYQMIKNFNKEKENKLLKYGALYITGLIVLAFIINFAAQLTFGYIVIKPEYQESMKYIIWIAFAFAVFSIDNFFRPFLVYKDKLQLISKYVTIAVVINLVGNYYLIKLNGIAGAAQATLLSYIFTTVAIILLSNKYFPLSWKKLLKFN